jgi:type II secretory pathway component PulF
MEWKQRTQIWISWTTTVATLISFIMLSYVVPRFEELFADFGADLPAFTKFVLNVHDYFFLLALPGFIGNVLIHNFKNSSGWWLVGFTGLMGIALIPLTIIAMYLPIFEMGSIVNNG